MTIQESRPQDAPSFPFARTPSCPFDPAPEYSFLRESQPVRQVTLQNGDKAWLVARYEDVREVLADGRLSVEPRPGMSNIGARPGAFINMDPPEHGRLRRMLNRDFMVKRINAMRPAIQLTVDGLVDGLIDAGPPVDLVEAFAYPLPSIVICQLLGVPYEDHSFFQERTQIIATRGTTPEQRINAFAELEQYLAQLVAAKAREPGEDLISRMLAEQVASGALTHEELAGMGTILLAAGHETTGNMVALGLLTLLQHPEQLEELRADPSLIPAASDELLRYLSIIDTTARTAREDFEVAGQLIRAGEGVICLMSSANRDDRVFANPDSLDIHRNARNHVAFGQGIHMCIGAPLARLELEVAFATLIDRLPNLHLAAPLEEIRFKDGMNAYGVWELPVAW